MKKTLYLVFTFFMLLLVSCSIPTPNTSSSWSSKEDYSSNILDTSSSASGGSSNSENQSTSDSSSVGGTQEISIGLKFLLISTTNTYSVVGIGTCKDKNLIIPQSYNDLPVTDINYKAFYGCSSLTSIVIPNSVTSIGGSAFYYCDSLTSITFEEESKLKSIGESAFSNCSSLASIVIPNSVTSIGKWAFSNCSSLTIYCESSSKPSGWDSYWNNSGRPVYWGVIQEDIIYQDGLQYLIINGKAVVTGYEANETKVIIPNTIEVKGVIYEVTSIGKMAFSNCRSLASIVIPNGVTSIGESAFYYCDSLTSITFEEESKLKSIGESAFYYCNKITSIIIPNGVTSIGNEAFWGCFRLVEVYNLSNLVITKGSYGNGCIGQYALNIYNDTSILSKLSIDNDGYLIYPEGDTKVLVAYTGTETKLMFPQGVTKMHNGAFCGCHSLMSIMLPNGMTSISFYAFDDCKSLSSIIIPDSVTMIRNGAFRDCKSLKSVYYKGTETEWHKISFPFDKDYLTTATKYYYSESEPALNEVGTAYDGNYWHYDIDGKTIIVWEKQN